MDSSQIIIFSLLAVVLFLYLRKYLATRNIISYTAEEVRSKLKQNAIVLLDVRTEAERKKNHIKGSLHVPLNLLYSRISELEKYKIKEIVCYCQSGSRSLSACGILAKKGFNVGNLKGGMSQWNF
ncbi:MAG: rhodanese-like domain-containing protein [Bacteroidota bacterium]|nr:rhodanese-like domain-containing protein [Bacteroidota bacterium]